MQNKLQIKVCGMREAENIQALSTLDIDFMGLIFYKKSKRYVEQDIPLTNTPKVGVFVNADLIEILEKIETYQLSYVQLHGDETPEYCAFLQQKTDCNIIKAFRVDESFDFEQTTAYESVCNYLLFDAKGKEYGGNGIIFNWDILQQYQGKLPFFLSGGLHLDSVKAIRAFQHPKLFALDINSGFETAPAMKNVPQIQQFIKRLFIQSNNTYSHGR